MSAHTPTPWNQGYSIPPFGDTPVVWNGRIRVAVCDRVEDAAHIVRCVNAHDELVAALREIADAEPAGSVPPDGSLTGWQAAHAKLCGYARAALAKEGAL